MVQRVGECYFELVEYATLLLNRRRFTRHLLKSVKFAMHNLNHRPKKCFGFKIPHEVFMMRLQLQHQAATHQTRIRQLTKVELAV